MIPSFLYIGPPKSASTWLYETLRAHPQIFVPSAKDLYYFDRYYDRGPEWYAGFFPDQPSAIAAGELSHDYLYSSEAAERIARDLPHAVLLLILRQPFDRALSEYMFLKRSGFDAETFDQAVEKYDSIIGKSLYGAPLKAYWDRFAPEQVATFVYDDLLTDPEGFANTVYATLAVPPLPELAVEGRVNAQSAARSVLLARLAKSGAELARSVGLSGVVGMLKRNPYVLKMLYTPPKFEKIAISRALVDQMAETFEADIDRLENLTHRSFPTLRHAYFPKDRIEIL